MKYFNNTHLFFLLSVICLFNFIACSANENIIKRYYCHFYEDKRTSSFDTMPVIIQTQKGRKVDLGYHNTLYKTYDEGHHILTVYKEHNRDFNYEFFKLDLSQSTNHSYSTNKKEVFLHSGYALHITPKRFESAYQMPFTKDNLKTINRNPELIKYLPPKSSPKQISIAFIKNKYYCHSLSYWGYVKKSFIAVLIAILSAG